MNSKHESAIRTLESLGYKFCGGEYWKPPIGNLPDFIGKTKEEAESKDWPQVGDEVLYNGSSSRFKSIKGAVSKVIAKYSFDGIDYITIKNESDGIFAMVFGSWIKKPKTAEEELRDELWDDVCIDSITLSQASEIFETILAKYNITKKPQ
jgi:hypothetical protein